MHGDFSDTSEAAWEERLKMPGPWYAPRQELSTKLARGEWLAVTRQGEQYAQGAVLSCPKCRRHSYTFLSRERVLGTCEFSFECSKCSYKNVVILLLLGMPPVGWKYRQALGSSYLNGKFGEVQVEWTYKGNGQYQAGDRKFIAELPPLTPDPDPVANFFNERKMENPFNQDPSQVPGNWHDMQTTDEMNSASIAAASEMQSGS